MGQEGGGQGQILVTSGPLSPAEEDGWLETLGGESPSPEE